MEKPRIGIIALVLLVLAIILIAWIAVRDKAPKEAESRVYESDIYGLSLPFGEDYVLKEGYVSDPSSPHYDVTLYAKNNLPKSENGEGPTSITLDVFSNSLSKTPLEAWVRQSKISNFHLSNGQLIKTTVDGTPAVTYTWDGLYKGKTVAFEHKGNIILMSVTYNNDQDQIKRDFEKFLFSLDLK